MSVRRYNCEGYFDPTAYEAFINIEKETRAASLESQSRRVPNYRPLVYICSPYAGDIGSAMIPTSRLSCTTSSPACWT